MNSQNAMSSARRRPSLFSGRVKALIIALALLAGAAVVNPIAGAQPVGNPGALNLKIVDGTIVLGAQTFPLKPAELAECGDAKNNDDGQDTVIDFPSDPQCTSLLDASEIGRAHV